MCSSDKGKHLLNTGTEQSRITFAKSAMQHTTSLCRNHHQILHLRQFPSRKQAAPVG